MALEGNIGGMAKKMFRYADDYLVFVEKRDFNRKLVDVLKIFKEEGRGVAIHLLNPEGPTPKFSDQSRLLDASTENG